MRKFVLTSLSSLDFWLNIFSSLPSLKPETKKLGKKTNESEVSFNINRSSLLYILARREIRKILVNHPAFKMSAVLRASGDAASVASTRQNPDEIEDFNIVDIDALQQHGINVADIKVFNIFSCVS